VAEISQELGIHVITLYKWHKAWLPDVNYEAGSRQLRRRV